MLPLMLALALMPGDHPGADSGAGDVQQVHVLARLTPEQARRLDGQSALFLANLDSLPDEHDGWPLCDCTSPVGTHATIWLCPAEPVADRMMVKATLRVIRHPPATGFPGFTE